jgi:hypothetical protein
VVVNEELEILQFRGHMSPFLGPSPGAPSFNLLRFMRLELHMPLAPLALISIEPNSEGHARPGEG